jgi:hypothetical protein
MPLSSAARAHSQTPSRSAGARELAGHARVEPGLVIGSKGFFEGYVRVILECCPDFAFRLLRPLFEFPMVWRKAAFVLNGVDVLLHALLPIALGLGSLPDAVFKEGGGGQGGSICLPSRRMGFRDWHSSLSRISRPLHCRHTTTRPQRPGLGGRQQASRAVLSPPFPLPAPAAAFDEKLFRLLGVAVCIN